MRLMIVMKHLSYKFSFSTLFDSYLIKIVVCKLYFGRVRYASGRWVLELQMQHTQCDVVITGSDSSTAMRLAIGVIVTDLRI